MNKKLLFMAFILTGTLFTGCDMLKQKSGSSHPDPNGSKSERRAYHTNEIKKYQTATDSEKKSSLRSLHKRDMNEVRRSNDKQVRYDRKVKEHNKAIKDLDSDGS